MYSLEVILSPTNVATTLDGVIQENEYSYEQSFDEDRVRLHLNWTADVFSVAITANTPGWVSVGFGSLKMNESRIFIGYVDDTGAAFRTDLGQGYAHMASAAESPLGQSLSESGGYTTMELEALPTQHLDADGQLPLILAYGRGDSFTSMHSFRTSLTVPHETPVSP